MGSGGDLHRPGEAGVELRPVAGSEPMKPTDDTREDLGGGVGGQMFYGVGRGADVPVGEP
jgi:hypothetical protein